MRVNTPFSPQKWPPPGPTGSLRLTLSNLRAGARWEVQGGRARGAEMGTEIPAFLR